MATLEELLALLPDNTTGAIDAADLREIVSTLWMNDEALLGAINSLGPVGGATVTGTWQVNPQANATPGGMQVTCDTGSFASATELYFTSFDLTNTDMSGILLSAGSLYGQQQVDATSWVWFDVRDTPTTTGAVVTIPVTVLASSPGSDSAAWQNAVVVIRTEA